MRYPFFALCYYLQLKPKRSVARAYLCFQCRIHVWHHRSRQGWSECSSSRSWNGCVLGESRKNCTTASELSPWHVRLVSISVATDVLIFFRWKLSNSDITAGACRDLNCLSWLESLQPIFILFFDLNMPKRCYLWLPQFFGDAHIL